MKKKKSWKKKTALGVAATAASAGMLVGGAFDSPADLLTSAGGDDSPVPIVETLTYQTPNVLADNNHSDDDDEQGRRQRFGAIRRWIQTLPLSVRSLVGLPLWCVGWALGELLTLLCQAAMSPLGSRILSWLLAAGAAVLVYALTAKALFPNAPWKKILRPRSLFIVLGGMALLGAADTLLTVFWAHYPPIGRLARLIGGALLLIIAIFSTRRLSRLWGRTSKTSSIPQSKRTETEQQAMALADRVCPPSAPRP